MPLNQGLDRIFDNFLTGGNIFVNRDVLGHDYIPENLPHRNEQIQRLGSIVAPSLNGSKVSNAFIYGKTGTGKTAVAKYVLSRLEAKSRVVGSSLRVCYVNCRLAGTNYRVLADLCRSLSLEVPFTGIAVNELLKRYERRLESDRVAEVIALDEIDALIKRKEDDSLLYELTRLNETLVGSSISLIGVSNDLHFKEFLDARVVSCLSEEEVVFKPYSADELYDILSERAREAFVPGSLVDSSLRLCSALAAREHGDARRALDLLRVAGEVAERGGRHDVSEEHVRVAEHKIEHDRFTDALRFLPLHQKIILVSAFDLDKAYPEGSITGDIYQVYAELCNVVSLEPLTQRRISGLLNELDIMGLLNARVVSFGRHGRTKKIRLGVPASIIVEVLSTDDMIGQLFSYEPKRVSRRAA